MGPRRNRAAAREVLAEPLLSVILDQASKAQAAGWFWTYDLKNAQARAQGRAVLLPFRAAAAAAVHHWQYDGCQSFECMRLTQVVPANRPDLATEQLVAGVEGSSRCLLQNLIDAHLMPKPRACRFGMLEGGDVYAARQSAIRACSTAARVR